jgi:hypothetical protein
MTTHRHRLFAFAGFGLTVICVCLLLIGPASASHMDQPALQEGQLPVPTPVPNPSLPKYWYGEFHTVSAPGEYTDTSDATVDYALSYWQVVGKTVWYYYLPTSGKVKDTCWIGTPPRKVTATTIITKERTTRYGYFRLEVSRKLKKPVYALYTIWGTHDKPPCGRPDKGGVSGHLVIYADVLNYLMRLSSAETTGKTKEGFEQAEWCISDLDTECGPGDLPPLPPGKK